MFRKSGYWYSFVALVLMLALLMPLVLACDDDDDEDETTAPMTDTPAATTAPPPTTTMPPATTEPPAAGLSIDMSIGDLLEDPDGEAILRNCLGDDVIDNPQMSMAFGMTVPEVSTMTDKITDETVACVEAALAELASGGTAELPFVDDPIEIAFVIDYTGPAAMAGFLADGVMEFAEWLWNEQEGGIVVGDVRRPLKFEKYDNEGQIAKASAAATKALLDGVEVVVMGGVSSQFGFPVADVTDPEKVLYSTFFSDAAVYDDYQWTVGSFFNKEARTRMTAEMIVNELKPQTIGLLAHQMDVDVRWMKDLAAAVQALDPAVEVVFEEYYQMGTTDLSPLLTKVRFEQPDVLICLAVEAGYEGMATQMPGLGGWGDTQVITLTEAGNFKGIEENEGADGWLVAASYLTGYPRSAASVAFGEDWAEKCESDSDWCKKYSPTGSVPLPNHSSMYNPVLTAIKAIQLAGSDDRAAIADAARSGNLTFDSPLGELSIGTDGKSSFPGFYIRVKDGVRTPFYGFE